MNLYKSKNKTKNYEQKGIIHEKEKNTIILLAACLLLGNVQEANAASIDNGTKYIYQGER